MAEPKIQSLPEEEAIDEIVETVRLAAQGTAPFALVLGSGFSQGLVPVVREIVGEILPLWMKSLKEHQSFETQKEIPHDQRTEIARDFWSEFVKRNASRGLVLPLDSQTALPETYSDAYKAVFTPEYFGAVGEPFQARRFQRALMQLDKPRLNAAHFLLASLIGVQPGKSRGSNSFKFSAAFSRLILTTNFDPFLQTALQAVNRLYFMSDTPELGVGDEIFDDETDAIHLVYLHGTIHRRSQAATDEDIKTLKEKNARTLAPVLERHGVIVLGYSGWDDAVVEALAACDRFDHRLYWCGRESDPLAKGAFGPRVPDILHKPSALYVRTAGAGHFMAELCGQLVNGLPRLLDNPIGQLREMLETIDLKELKNLGTAHPVASNTPQLIDIASNTEAFAQAQELTLQRLREVEQVFLFRGQGVPPPKETETPQPLVATPSEQRDGRVSAAPSVDPKKQIEQLLSSARVAAALGNHAETLKLCKEAFKLAPIEPADMADLLLLQAGAHYFLGDQDEAISNLSQIAKLPGAPVEQVALALNNRGITWGEKGETEKELADYTRVIEQLPGAPVEQVALALNNRGIIWGKKGDTEKALADFTRLIEQLPGAPAEQVAMALGGRGWTNYLRGDYSAFLADTEVAVNKLPSLDSVAFNLGLALLAGGRDAEALQAYRDAGARFPQSIDVNGLADLDEARKKWLGDERAQPVIQLLQSLKK
ncbi:MAG: hypothetical protein DME59_08815 [Verrucomicrobia bacterium]|nr:MAG: hypothetical protein DME59_08815 [Verrucomicrobiota bacterium]